jgi:hypothetical protein
MTRTTTGWHRHFALLDVPIVVIADDPALLATACAAYADWMMVEAPAAGSGIELRLKLGGASTERVSAAIRVEGSRLTLSGGGIDGEADARTGRARCVVPPWLADDPAALAAEIVDTLLLFLLARTGGRIPVHAAGVMLGDTALVLAGPSGAGKSTLALAAKARGLQVLSDDTLYVQRDPRLRVWGLPRPIHVFAKDAPPGPHAVRLRGGKEKAAIPLADRGSAEWVAERARLIVLRRGESLDLSPIDRATAIAALSRLDAGFDLLAEASTAAIRALAQDGAHVLTLVQDPRRAIDFLVERLVLLSHEKPLEGDSPDSWL